jgi:hypothetical protein
LGVVIRLDRTVGGMQRGSSAQVFGLSGRGLGVLDVPGPYGRRRRTVWETKPYFMQHVLGVAEVCVGLTELSRGGTAELLTFDGEPAAWRQFADGIGATVTLKPDAYVRVGVGAFERSAFVELDMASESLPTIERKCLRYLAYWRTTLEQRHHGVFPVVLWLVPTEARQHRVREVTERLTTERVRLFEVMLQSDGPAALAAPMEAVG